MSSEDASSSAAPSEQPAVNTPASSTPAASANFAHLQHLHLLMEAARTAAAAAINNAQAQLTKQKETPQEKGTSISYTYTEFHITSIYHCIFVATPPPTVPTTLPLRLPTPPPMPPMSTRSPSSVAPGTVPPVLTGNCDVCNDAAPQVRQLIPK